MADCNEKKENAPSEIMKKAEEYLASKRRIFLWGGVDDESAERIVKELLYLDSLNNEDIYFFINSPGGVISSGLAIYDCMNAIFNDKPFDITDFGESVKNLYSRYADIIDLFPTDDIVFNKGALKI